MSRRCDFCGSDHETENLVAGPRVMICSDCVELARDMLLEGPAARWLREVGEAEYRSWAV